MCGSPGLYLGGAKGGILLPPENRLDRVLFILLLIFATSYVIVKQWATGKTQNYGIPDVLFNSQDI